MAARLGKFEQRGKTLGRIDGAPACTVASSSMRMRYAYRVYMAQEVSYGVDGTGERLEQREAEGEGVDEAGADAAADVFRWHVDEGALNTRPARHSGPIN